MTCHCPRNLTFPRQPILTSMFFKISISFIKKLRKSFLVAFSKSLDHFMTFLFVLIVLSQFWTVFEVFEVFEDKSRNPRWRIIQK